MWNHWYVTCIFGRHSHKTYLLQMTHRAVASLQKSPYCTCLCLTDSTRFCCCGAIQGAASPVKFVFGAGSCYLFIYHTVDIVFLEVICFVFTFKMSIIYMYIAIHGIFCFSLFSRPYHIIQWQADRTMQQCGILNSFCYICTCVDNWTI